MNSFDTFTLAPMAAGDIIDRAVRLYRRNFLALLRIVLAPSLVAYCGSIIYYIGVRNFAFDRGDRRLTLTTLMIIVGGLLYLIGKVMFYAVLGGASRSLIYHFFDGTPLRARDVYQIVREKLWPLIGAVFMTALLLSGVIMIIYFIVIIMILIFAAFTALIGSGLPRWLQLLFGASFGILVFLIIAGIFLLAYSRVVYVPQVMMVEGKGVFSSIGRSFSLAGGEVKRVGALILFWFYIAWSIWLLMMIPLGWYGYWVGVDINPFRADEPIWYNISQQTLTQLSEILIAPIAMLGFTLLYLDSRVRKEGFDVELLANRILPPPPQIQQQQLSFSGAQVVEQPRPSTVPSILGLNDYPPVHIDSGSVASGVSETDDPSPAASIGAPPAGDAGAIDFVPVNLSETAIEMDAAQAGGGHSDQEAASTVTVEESRRVCRWCGTHARDEDRFCSVCGSVF